MTAPIVQITGPAGAGKSTLVRRIMSQFTERRIVEGGVGALPMGYELSQDGRKIFVLGNYSNDGRARYGMAQFNRFAPDFEKALMVAVGKAESEVPVLLEGGFQRTGRLSTLTGQRYLKLVHLIVLAPTDAICQLSVMDRKNSDISLGQWERHKHDVMRVAEKIKASGAPRELLEDREEAFRRVCHLLGIGSLAAVPESSWR